MRISWKQGLSFWVATTASLILAAWFNNSFSDSGFIREPNNTYDYIVVGAGTSGCVVAAKLAEIDSTANKVLAIEAGGEPPWYSWIPLVAPVLQGSQYDWRFRTVTQAHAAGALHNNQSFWPQGKMIGGSGQMNFLIHTTGSPSDYDSWRLPGWDSQSMKETLDRLTCWRKIDTVNPQHIPRSPFMSENDGDMCIMTVSPGGFHHENNHPFLCGEKNEAQQQCSAALIKLQRINATEVPLLKAFLDAGRACGHSVADMDRWSDKGSFMASHNTIDGFSGRRWNTYQSHLLPAMKRHNNLHVLTKSPVTQLVSRDNKVVGIQYLDANGDIKSVTARKEVILSAGSIKTTQILQLSGIGPSRLLDSLFVELNSSVSLNVLKLLHPRQFWNYMFYGKGALATSGIEGIATLTRRGTESESSKPYGMLILFNMGSINAEVYTSVANIKKEAFYQWFPKSDKLSQEGFVLISLCLHPRSRGYIRIVSTDPNVLPEIDPAYLSDQYDVQCTIDTIKQGVELLSTEYFQTLGAKLHWPAFPQCGENPGTANQHYMECLVRTAALTMYHPAGTAKMGLMDNKKSVVDPHFRVKGIKGLRVVDASVFPTLPSGPPNSILVAMAEKATEIILKQS